VSFYTVHTKFCDDNHNISLSIYAGNVIKWHCPSLVQQCQPTESKHHPSSLLNVVGTWNYNLDAGIKFIRDVKRKSIFITSQICECFKLIAYRGSNGVGHKVNQMTTNTKKCSENIGLEVITNLEVL